MAASGLVSAGPMGAMPAGGGLHPWNVPYHGVSAGMLASLQGFLATGSGKLLLAQVPTLGFIERLSPDSEAHRRVVGAIGLPSDFEPRLRDAVRTSDEKALSAAFAALLDAYHLRNAEERIREAVSARAEEIDAAFFKGKVGPDVLSAAAELAPFASLSDQAGSNHWRMRRIHQAAMDEARRMSAALPDSTGAGTPTAGAEAPAVPVTTWSRRAPEHRAAFAATLLEKLDRAETGEDAKEIVDRLRKTAENSGDESLQRTIVHGLIFEFLTVDRDDYHLHVLDALEKIAIASPFESVRKVAADGIRTHIPMGGDLSSRARDAVGTIVAASFRDKRLSKIRKDDAGIGARITGNAKDRVPSYAVQVKGNPILAWVYLGLMILALAVAVPEPLLAATVLLLALGYFPLFQ